MKTKLPFSAATCLTILLMSIISWEVPADNLLANGGFEMTGKLGKAKLDAELKKGMTFENADPSLPMRWSWWNDGPVKMGITENAPHGGKRALNLKCPQGSITLSMSFVEVVPKATYTFGAWVKGSGNAELVLYGIAFEGPKELARVKLEPSEGWKQSSQTVTIPGNIRIVRLDLAVWQVADVTIDDVFFSADLEQEYDADAVLTTKPKVDKHTLAFVDFDGQGECILENRAKIVDGGRFGKGLRLEKSAASSASLSLKLKKMPEEGTLEYWFAPDDSPDPEHSYVFSILMAGAQDLLCLQADTSGCVRATWRKSAGQWDPQDAVQIPPWVSREWFRPGQWHHVAIEWDKEAVRVYFDGVLAGYSTEKPLPFFNTASILKLGSSYSGYSWTGMIAEVRLSDVKRYGPIIPKGATWIPLVAVAEKTAALAASPVAKESPAPDFAAERAKQISPIPAPPEGTLSFDASQAKPLVEDNKLFEFQKGPDARLNGLVTAKARKPWQVHTPDYDGLYWKLDNVRPGKYFMGVWYESGKAGSEANQGDKGALSVYLNGRIVQLATTSDPVQAAPGIYFIEAQTKDAVELRPGDEIAVQSGVDNVPLCVARLTLYPKEPVRGRGWITEQFGSGWFTRTTALGLNLDCAFLPAAGKGLSNPTNYSAFRQIQGANMPTDLKMTEDGSKAVAQCSIINPLPVPLTVEYKAAVKEYFRETVGTDSATLTLKPHESITREIPFKMIPGCRHYSLEATAKAVNPPLLRPDSNGVRDYEGQANLGWPATDTVELLSGIRQSIPWPDPFTARDERALHFQGALPGERIQFSLNGQWDSAFTPSLDPTVPPPSDLKWEPRGIPILPGVCSIDKLIPKPHGMYFHRTFKLDELGEGKSFRLRIDNVSNEATAYVNGTKVGNVRGDGAPLLCDITKSIRKGDNEILLVVRDLLAIMDPAYVNKESPVQCKDYLDAPGNSGFELVGEVFISSSPLVAAGDLLVNTSTRKKEISARFNLFNRRSSAVKVKVSALVMDAGKPVLDMGEQTVTLEPEKSTLLRLVKPWKDPILWSPENPKLYTIAVETTDTETGQRLDLLRERFGFRESWLENARIMFNGAPIRLKGSWTAGGGGVMHGDDVQWTRNCGKENDFYYDFMDEFGYPTSCDISGIYNNPSRHNVERDLFWETARRNALANISLCGNRPSILAWDLSNEWLSFLDYGGGDPLAGAKRFKALSDAVKEADPSRWTFFNGDGDLHGLHDNISTHYTLESYHSHPIAGFGFDGHSVYFPDGAFYRPLSRDFKPGEEITLHSSAKLRYGEKVFMCTENIWKQGYWMPPGPSKFVGEEDVLSPSIDSGRGPIVWMWKQDIDGHKDLGASAICNSYGCVRMSMLQSFIMPDHTHHYFDGAKVERSYSLHNNKFTPSEYILQCRLTDTTGKEIWSKDMKHQMNSGDIQRGQFSFNLPKVDKRTKFTLKLDLSANGKFAYGEERDIEVWPDIAIPTGKLARKILLFDSEGTTAATMKKAGIPFETMSALATPKGDASSTVLIIGEKSVTEKNVADPLGLGAYVEAGGRVLVLAQDRLMPGLPVKTSFENREWSSMPFVRTPQHPIFTASCEKSEAQSSKSENSTLRTPHSAFPISSWDLHFWSPDHVSAKGAYSKPDGGSFVTLVDSGTNTGLEWVQTMECYRGRGSYLLCQLPVAGKYDVEPMAREMLSNLISYAAGQTLFRTPVSRLKVVAGTGSPTAAKLVDLGVACEMVQPEVPLDGSSVWLVDMSTLPEGFTAPVGWKTALQAGGTAVLHGITPKQAELVSSLADKSVTFTAQPLGMWDGRGYRNGFTALTPGLSHIDLYWKDYEGGEAGTAQAEQSKYMIEPIVYWSAGVPNAIEHIYPGALVEIPVGKGRLILDQVRWQTGNKKLACMSSRVVTALMTGLNVAIAPYIAPRDLPQDVIYKPIDISPLANRGFKDDVGGDGKGGWSDQGPKADLHEFPTGTLNFGGVPFQVGAEPHCCIVLKSDARPFPELLPEEVTIPLDYMVEGLWFLHSATHVYGGQVGVYQIQYSDGTSQDIILNAGENICDWTSPPAEFPKEKGTRSRVAWTGSCDLFPVVSVFQMLWVNPKPGTPVKAVRFANPTKNGCPIMMGLTAAVKAVGKSDIEASVAAQAKAKEWLKKGQEAFQSGRDDEARDALQKALKEAPELEAAHRTMGELCERSKDENSILAAYKAWAIVGARTPLPYNKMGEILERRKDFAGALEAYTKSLQIEWNQPPIIEAKTRLMMQLKK